MNLTEMLKSWLVKNCGVAKDATDDEFRKAAAAALVKGTLTPAKMEKLTIEEGDEKAVETLGHLAKSIDSPTSQMEDGELEKSAEPDTKQVGSRRFSKMVSSMGGTPVEIDGKSVDIRVKEAAEQYDTTRKSLSYPETTKNGAPHPLAGQRVKDAGRTIDAPSEQDKALAGAWAKFQIRTAQQGGIAERGFAMLTDHEKSLLFYMADNSDFDASMNGKSRTRKGYAGGMKALIDDSTSGGIEAAPIVFDDMVIQTPLLHGELYPLVNVVPLERGRRVEGVSTGTVTASWGGVDDTAIDLFNTASYVSAFDTTVFRWEGAIRIGLDFLDDSPIDFGAHITAQYGERMLEDLDDVIAAGNGTTQPEGIINKSGTTSVNFGSTTSIGNYESLRFGVAKAEHRPDVAKTAVFIGNETSYQRARALPVGSSDARRLFGMDYDGYSIMERPYKINETLANTQIMYAILARYRMYRRKGIDIRTTTEGDTLVRRNEMMIVAMARYGGQLERGACAAVTTSAPS